MLELDGRRAAVRRPRARRRSAARAFHPAALTFDGPDAVPAVRELVSEPDARQGGVRGVRRPDGCHWALPMYELALMVRGRARRRDVLLVTSEPAPLAVFGEEPSRAVGEMLDPRGHRDPRRRGPHRRPTDGRAIGLAADGPWLSADRIVAPPLLDGPRLRGVPHDAARLHPRRRARSRAGARSRVRRRRRHGPRDQAGRARGAAGGRGDPAPDGRGRRAPAPRSVPSCPARSAHDRPGRSLPASRSGRRRRRPRRAAVGARREGGRPLPRALAGVPASHPSRAAGRHRARHGRSRARSRAAGTRSSVPAARG